VDPNTTTQKVSIHNVGMLLDKYLELLPNTNVHEYLGALPQNITLLGVEI
jgi:hypothetical protein